MTIPYYNILDVSQFSLKTIRQRTHDGKVGVVTNIGFNCLALMFEVLTIMSFFHFDGNINLLANLLESLTTFSQTFIKLVPLLIYRKRIQHLFDAMKHFWNPEDFPEVLPEIKETYKYTYYFLLSYQWVLYLTLVFFYVQPFFHLDILMATYVPNIPGAFWVILVLEYPMGFLMCSAMTGFDTLYVAFFTHLVIQLKCLNNAMETMDMKSPNFNKTLRKYLNHHKFILSFADELLNIVGIPMLGQYIVSMFLTCMEFYLLSDSFENPLRLLMSLGFTASLLFQFWCYCYSATEFTTEASLLGEGVYMSRWYEGTPSQQKMLSFVILRAQKEVKCTAAGLVEIDRRAFMAVIKAAVSFYTLMKQF